METNPVSYDRISQDPTNFEGVFRRQLSLADDLRRGTIDYQRGTAESKALHGANRTLETDLSARMFEHRLNVHQERQRQLPGASERSGDARIADKRSQSQAAESSGGPNASVKARSK